MTLFNLLFRNSVSVNTPQTTRSIVPENLELNDEEIQHIQKHGFISHVTDPEGNLEKFEARLAANEEIIQYFKEKYKEKYPELKEAKTVYVFGGDMTDKGTRNIAILNKIEQLAKEKNEVVRIIGNRDHNKIRLKEALNPKLKDKFCQLITPYCGDLDWKVSPKSYIESMGDQSLFAELYKQIKDNCRQQLKLKNNSNNKKSSKDSDINTYHMFPTIKWDQLTNKDYWQGLDTHVKTLIIMQYLCEKTMGAPNYLNDLYSEFSDMFKKAITPSDMVSLVFQLHFERKYYNEWARKGYIPEIRNDLKIDPLQADYRKKALFGYKVGDTLILHAAHNAYPYLQNGKSYDANDEIRLRADKLKSYVFWSSLAATLSAVSSALMLSSISWSVPLAAVACLFAINAMFYYILICKITNKVNFEHWMDARLEEDKENTRIYLEKSVEDMHSFENEKSLLNKERAVDAAMGQDSKKTSLAHNAISFNSAMNPLAKNELFMLKLNSDTQLLVAGHQPASTPQIKKYPHRLEPSPSHYSVVEADTSTSLISNECGGGVITGARFISTQSHQDKVLLIDSEKLAGKRELIGLDLPEELQEKYKDVYSIQVGTDADGKPLYKIYNININGYYEDYTVEEFPDSLEIMKLKTEIGILQNEIVPLQQEIDKLQNDIDSSPTIIESLKKKIYDLNKNYEKLQNNHSHWSEELYYVNSEEKGSIIAMIKDYSIKMKESYSNITNHYKEIESNKKKIESNKKEIKSNKKRIESYNEKIKFKELMVRETKVIAESVSDRATFLL